jgi:hypothetical protein
VRIGYHRHTLPSGDAKGGTVLAAIDVFQTIAFFVGIVLLFYCAWRLRRIDKSTEAIRFMLFRDYDQRFGQSRSVPDLKRDGAKSKLGPIKRKHPRNDPQAPYNLSLVARLQVDVLERGSGTIVDRVTLSERA